MSTFTTDPQDEEFDVLDRSGAPTGRRKRRGDVHRDGDWHGALHVWVGSLFDGVPYVLLQRRSHTKDSWPGRVDVAVGGHLSAGETIAQAVRETREEIGLDLSFDDLTRLGRRFVSAPPADNEIQDVFGVRADLPLAQFAPHPEEVDALLQLPLAAVLELHTGARTSVEALELVRGAPHAQSVMLTLDAFIPAEDGYYGLALEALRALILDEPVVRFKLR